MTLKERRQKAGLLQVDVARKLEVDQTAVSKWETGNSKPVKKYREKLAILYGCSADDLLREESTE